VATAKSESTENGVGVRDLLEAGLHFGHQTKRWNPKMRRYIFDKRNGIHIIDLAKSLALLEGALQYTYEVVAGGGRILFVGTKKQAQQIIRETAENANQFYVSHRWLGGTLTNRTTIRRSVKRMRDIEDLEKKDGLASFPKKEAASLRRELSKLQRNLSGVADMDKLPGAVFVVDINREAIAVAEAVKLNIPVIAIVDTNCDPDPIDYVIPGNDDAIRAIRLIATSLGGAIEKGNVEYAKIAAELARKEEEAKQKEAEARKAAEAEAARKAEEAAAKEQAEKPVADEKAKKPAAKAAAAKKAKKPAAEPAATEEKAEAPAAEPEIAAEKEEPAPEPKAKAAPKKKTAKAKKEEAPAEPEPEAAPVKDEAGEEPEKPVAEEPDTPPSEDAETTKEKAGE